MGKILKKYRYQLNLNYRSKFPMWDIEPKRVSVLKLIREKIDPNLFASELTTVMMFEVESVNRFAERSGKLIKLKVSNINNIEFVEYDCPFRTLVEYQHFMQERKPSIANSNKLHMQDRRLYTMSKHVKRYVGSSHEETFLNLTKALRMGKTEYNYGTLYEGIKKWAQRNAKMMMLINNGDYVFDPAKLSYVHYKDKTKLPKQTKDLDKIFKKTFKISSKAIPELKQKRQIK